MIKCNLKTVRNHAAKQEDFDCNGTLTGKWTDGRVYWGQLKDSIDLANHLYGGGNTYVIYSYETPIAVYKPLKGWWVNPNKYSVTTSRHQSAIGI